jgi:NADH-quinone oxidoreductase subunit A
VAFPARRAPTERKASDLLSDYGPLAIYAVIVLAVVGLLLTLSFVLGPSKPYRAKLLPYESGMVPKDPARKRLSVRFYLTAMLFIIFDVEAVFFYPWAVLLHQLRWYGVIEMFVFMLILLVALAHIWRKGGLDWE